MNRTRKSRVLSVLLALVMAFSAVPVTAFAADGVAVAEVTVGSTTMSYADVDEAFADAVAKDSSTLKLLENATAANEVTVSSGTHTLDLNGKTLTSTTASGEGFLYISGGTLTIQDSGTGGAITSVKSTLRVNSGGSLTVTGGSFTGGTANGLIVFDGGSAQLSGGTFASEKDPHSIWVTSGKAADLLVDGYRYETEDDALSDYSENGNGVKGKTTVCKIPEGEVTYIGTDGKEARQAGCIELTGKGFANTNYDGTYWFAAKGNVTVEDVLSAHGTINLILCDGATVTASRGVTLQSNGEQRATLNIYAQSAGTGKLVATGTVDVADMTAGIRNAVNSSGEATLNIYGGTVEAKGAQSAVKPGEDSYSGAGIGTYVNDESGNTINVNIYGGTVIAQSGGKGGAAIGNGQGSTATVKVAIAEGMKCVKTNAPTEKAEYSNTDGDSVTITKCDKHLWSYTDKGDGTHIRKCALCGKDGDTAAHSFGGWADNGNGNHTGACTCGATSTVGHTLSYVITNTHHKQACGVCGYETAEAAHSFDETTGKCDCGADKDIAVEKAEVTMTAPDGTVTTARYTDLLKAFDDADTSQADKIEVRLLQSGKTYTLDSTETFPIWFEYTHNVEVTVDLNDCTLERTVTDNTHGILKVETGNVTLKNGTLHLDDSAADNPAQAIEMEITNYGDNTTLTLENMTIKVADIKEGGFRTAKGYAIRAEGGTLNIESGTYGKVFVNDEHATAKLSGGSYESVTRYVSYADLLATGYIFAKQSDNSYVDLSDVAAGQRLTDVKVIPCTHEGGYTSGSCDRCGAECAHTNVENGNCPDCNMQMVAQDNSGRFYANLEAAFVGVADKGTVTLLADVDNAGISCYVNADRSALIEKTVTLDMNGHSLSRGDMETVLTVGIGKLTVINGAGGTDPIEITNTDEGCAVEVCGGTLAFGGKVKLTGGLQVIEGGKLEGGLKEGSILIAGTGNAIGGGSASSVSVRDSFNNQNYGVVRDLLGEGLAFAKYDKDTGITGDIVSGNEPNLTENVIVVKCGHKNGEASLFENGTCTACGYECPHKDVTNTTCGDCGAQMVAQVGDSYYSTLAAAIEAAKNDGTVEMVSWAGADAYDVTESVTVKADTKVTINMNNTLWQAGDAASPLLTVNGGNVTLNGEGHLSLVSGSTAGGIVVVEGGSLTLGESMVVGNNDWDGPAIVVNGGDLTLGKDTLLYDGMKTSVEGKTLADYLPEGYAFANDNRDGSILNGYVQELKVKIQMVVVEHTHDLQKVTPADDPGRITGYRCACGFTCEHKWNFDDKGICEDCGLLCKHDWVCEDLDNKTNYCGYCKMFFAVWVRIEGVSDKYYMRTFDVLGTENTLQTLLSDDAITPPGSTVTLLADDLNAWAHVDDGKNITLDLNGKNLIETSNGILVGTGSKLTVTGEGSSSENDQQNLPCVFNVQGGTLELGDKFGGTFNCICVGSGTLTSTREEKDSINIGTLQINGSDAKISFKQGTFGKIATQMPSVSVKLGDLLGTWQDAEGNTVRSGNAFRYTTGDKAFVRYDTVIDINNPVENVKTAACTHDSVTGRSCDYCGTENLVATVIDGGGAIATYAAEDDSEAAKTEAIGYALKGWNDKDGYSKTMKLFVDFAVGDMTLRAIASKTTDGQTATERIIDLNGHKITGGEHSLLVGNLVTLTIKDTSASKADAPVNITLESGATLAADGVKIGSVTLKDGSKLAGQIGGIFETITAESGSLIDFLPTDYAFADAEDHAIRDARSAKLNNVTVAEHRAHGNYFWENHKRICACGRVVDTDTTAPTVSGIDSSNVCYGDLLFTAEDAYLAKVTVDGAEVAADGNGKYTVTADNREHTIIARDMAGNETTVTVTVYMVYRVTLPDGVGYTVSGEGTAKHGQSYTFTVKIKEGYTATDVFAVGVKGSSSFAIPQPDSTGTYTFVLPAGQVAGDLEVTVEGVRDTTAPEAKLTMGQKEFNSFSSSITFDLLLKETQTVRIEAADSGSGVKSVKYYVADKAMTRDAVAAITDWTEGERFVIEAKDGQQFVVYARIEDNAGNVTYLSSDGAEFDTAAPSIGGVADGETHYVTRKISVRDKNLKSVKLNGVEVNPEFTLDGNIEAEYKIEAIDMMGNVATFTIKMRPISALAETFKDRTEANVTADDKGKLDKLGEDIQAMLSSEGVTADESDALNALLKTANGLLERIDEAKSATESKEITAVKDLTKDNVTADDKEALEKAEKALNDARKDFDGNYTEEERESLDRQVKTIEDALGAIANAEKAAREIGKLPAADDVTTADKGEVERVKKLLEDLTDSEKAMLGKETLDRVTALEDKLRQLEDAAVRTGDSGQSALWLALLCLSGGTAAAMAVQGNRKKREK